MTRSLGRAEAEALVERVRIARVQEPLRVDERPFVHGEAHQLDAEAAAAVLVEDVDVREVRLRVAVGQRPREADLPPLVVEADDARVASSISSS